MWSLIQNIVEVPPQNIVEDGIAIIKKPGCQSIDPCDDEEMEKINSLGRKLAMMCAGPLSRESESDTGDEDSNGWVSRANQMVAAMGRRVEFIIGSEEEDRIAKKPHRKTSGKAVRFGETVVETPKEQPSPDGPGSGEEADVEDTRPRRRSLRKSIESTAEKDIPAPQGDTATEVEIGTQAESSKAAGGKGKKRQGAEWIIGEEENPPTEQHTEFRKKVASQTLESDQKRGKAVELEDSNISTREDASSPWKSKRGQSDENESSGKEELPEPSEPRRSKRKGKKK